jgi:hypothetical protein
MVVVRPSGSARALAALSGLCLPAGAGGMAVSFLFLAAPSLQDTIAGAAGFVAGAVLLAGGIVGLALVHQEGAPCDPAASALNALWALLPPAVAAAGWPALYFTVGLGVLVLMPVVLGVCLVLAWPLSARAARGLGSLLGVSGEAEYGGSRSLQLLLFAGQVVSIALSWPLFSELLNMMQAMGYKVGWS